MEESWELKPKIEALLVASDRPVSIAALAACLGVTEDEADEALREFEADLLGADRGIQLRRRPHGVRIETKAQIRRSDRAPLARAAPEAHHLAGSRNPGHHRLEAAGFDRRHQRHPRRRERRNRRDASEPPADRALRAPWPPARADLADHAGVSGDLRPLFARRAPHRGPDGRGLRHGLQGGVRRPRWRDC